jgi:hypothetical protein
VRRPGRRYAFVEGFSLHADTWLHDNDVVGLEGLCNYGARGPLSLERLSALPDGRLAYRMKRASPQTHSSWLRGLPLVALVRPRGQPHPLLGSSPQRQCVRVVPRLLPCGAHRGSFLPLAPEPVRPRPRHPSPRRLPSGTFQTDVLCLRGHPPRRGRRPPLLDGPGHPRLKRPSTPLPLAPATSPPQLGLW